MAAVSIVSDAKSTSMSMIGFAARPGAAVLPTCFDGRRHVAEGIGDSCAKALKQS
jgi:hypothetical protein